MAESDNQSKKAKKTLFQRIFWLAVITDNTFFLWINLIETINPNKLTAKNKMINKSPMFELIPIMLKSIFSANSIKTCGSGAFKKATTANGI